jgi:Ca-activated chloride channel family protein
MTTNDESPSRRRRRTAPLAAVVAALGLVVAAACTVESGDDPSSAALGDPGDCIVVDVASSPEKIELLTDLARTFNKSGNDVDGRCIFVRPQSKSSGASAAMLAEGWDAEAEGPEPVIWSPAASTWGAVLDQRLADQGQTPMAGEGEAFMNTPLVIAMPQPMAEALGWPDEPLGWSDVLALTRDPEGWAAFGHPEWGEFRLGKTNPNFSTSGLAALVAQTYAATGTTKDLTLEDLDSPKVEADARSIESAVVHYGDTTLTFLENWYRADQRGLALTYASAVAVEEKSVIDYNTGNPDGRLDPGEQPRPPRVPLVAIYPEEGTLFSDNPFFILDADWVSDEQRRAAETFGEFVQTPDNQRRVLEFGFRPGNIEVPLGDPIVAANGVDPDEPQTTLQVPDPPVLTALIDRWGSWRKEAQVLLVIDISGSMGEPADPSGGPETKLDLAQSAATSSLDEFKPADLVGLRAFSTGLGEDQTANWIDLVDIATVGEQSERIAAEVRRLFPTNGTPLYEVAQDSFDTVVSRYDPTRINAVVLLTDGVNDDGTPDDDRAQLDALLADLEQASQGENSTPVRLFTIGYGADADLGVLRRMAEATNGASYNASDPRSIEKVFAAVVSNF